MRWSALLALLMSVSISAISAQADDFRVEDLMGDLRNGNVERRWQAARLLGTLGTRAKPAVVYLTIALRDENRTVRYYAARSLAAIGPAAGDIAGANLLEAAVNDSNRYVREEAGSALRVVDPAPLFLKVPWLYAGVDGKPRDVMAAFRVHKHKPIFELVQQLRDKDVKQRREAVRLLGRLRWRAAPAATPLTVALRDDDETVRIYAAEALGDIGLDVFNVAHEMLRHVSKNDPSKRVREQAELTLRTITPRPDERTIPTRTFGDFTPVLSRSILRQELPSPTDRLSAELVSDDVSARRSAAWELARRGQGDNLAVRYLVHALVDDDELVRFNATTALGRLGPAAGKLGMAGLQVVRRSDESNWVVERAVLAMQLVDPQAGERTRISGPDPDEPRRAIKRSNLDIWLSGLRGTDVNERIAAIRSLTKRSLNGRKSLPRLIPLLRDENQFVRAVAAETIGMIGFRGDSSLVHDLSDLMNDDRSDFVRAAADEALLLNLDEHVVAQMREPKPPGLPTPRKVVRKGRTLSDRNISALVGLLREEPEHREMAMRILASRMVNNDLAPIVVPLAMGSAGELRNLSMSALWKKSAKDDVAAPLIYAMHRGLGTAHKVDLIDRIEAGHAFSPYLVPYVVRSDDERIRQSGLRAWSRVTSKKDWRQILLLPWKYWDEDRYDAARRALTSLDAKDAVIRSFLAGGLTTRDDVTFVRFVIALGAAMNEERLAVKRLARLFHVVEPASARLAIVRGLSSEKPKRESRATKVLVVLLKAEPERSIRDAMVGTLRGYGSIAEEALPALLAQLKNEDSIESQMRIAEAIKVIGADNAELQAIVVQLEESLRIQRARELLGELISEQAKLEEETRRRQKRLLLRSLAN